MLYSTKNGLVSHPAGRAFSSTFEARQIVDAVNRPIGHLAYAGTHTRNIQQQKSDSGHSRQPHHDAVNLFECNGHHRFKKNRIDKMNEW